MSKFDRCIFISIAIGIWALAMVQMFKPDPVTAKDGFTDYKKPTLIWAECPKWYTGNVSYGSDGVGENTKYCNFQMVVTYDDLVKYRKHLK